VPANVQKGPLFAPSAGLAGRPLFAADLRQDAADVVDPGAVDNVLGYYAGYGAPVGGPAATPDRRWNFHDRNNKVYWAPPGWPRQHAPVAFPRVARLLVSHLLNVSGTDGFLAGDPAFADVVAWLALGDDLAAALEGSGVLCCPHEQRAVRQSDLAADDGLNPYFQYLSDGRFLRHLAPPSGSGTFFGADVLNLVIYASRGNPAYWDFTGGAVTADFSLELANLAAFAPLFPRHRTILYVDGRGEDPVPDYVQGVVDAAVGTGGIEDGGVLDYHTASVGTFLPTILDHFGLASVG
jgi:hypothetical protein